MLRFENDSSREMTVAPASWQLLVAGPDREQVVRGASYETYAGLGVHRRLSDDSTDTVRLGRLDSMSIKFFVPAAVPGRYLITPQKRGSSSSSRDVSVTVVVP